MHFGSKQNEAALELFPKDMLWEQTKTPIKRGDVIFGALIFVLPPGSVERAETDGAIWKIRFLDYKKNVYEMTETYAKVREQFRFSPGVGNPLRVPSPPGEPVIKPHR